MTDISPGEQRVFIIHGRNQEAVTELCRFLRALGLVPLLFEKVSTELPGNPYIGEVVEAGILGANIVIALLTPDERTVLQHKFHRDRDEGRDRRRFQSRPNVFFEIGIASGIAKALGRKPPLMVVAGEAELPSDFDGRHLYQLSNDEKSRRTLRDALENMGCALAPDETFLEAGDFSDRALFGKEKPRLPDAGTKSVDLLLGPGGVRCLAFAGAITALERNGYSIGRIFGVSGGALIAAGYASSADIARVIQLVRGGELLRIIRPPGFWGSLKALRPPFAAHSAIDRSFFNDVLGGDPTLGELKVPLGVAALDIAKSRLLAYTSDSHPSMKAVDALTSSTAVPFFYPWVTAGDRLIVDVAVQTQLPLWLPAAFKTPSNNRVVALSVSVSNTTAPRTFADYVGRLFEAQGYASDHLDVVQSRRLVRIPIPVPAYGFLERLTEQQRMGLVTIGDSTVDTAIASGAMERVDRAVSITEPRGDVHEVAQTEATNASIRYARELQRFSEELDDV